MAGRTALTFLCWFLASLGGVVYAADHAGRVTFGGVPVPGATVTATQGEQRLVTSCDQNGIYHFADLAGGRWLFRVEMIGFVPAAREIDVTEDASPATWELSLLPFDQIGARAGLPSSTSSSLPSSSSAQSSSSSSSSSVAASDGASRTAERGPAAGRGTGAGRETASTGRATATDPTGNTDARGSANIAASATAANTANADNVDNPTNGGSQDPFGAANGLLINGSVNNGAASLFAQPAAFGNNRPGGGSLYNGNVGVMLGNSAWDARPYSFGSTRAPKPAYTDLQLVSTFGGPIKLPRVRTRPVVYLGYQHASDHGATTQSAVVPTLAERAGDFSRSVDALGRPVTIVDPRTGSPFDANRIPADRLSREARALLDYYPAPNVSGDGFNFQRAVLTDTRQDSLQSRISHALPRRNQLLGTLAYQRTAADTTSIFGFTDDNTSSTLDAAANWTHRFSQTSSLRLRYQFTRAAGDLVPYFANRFDVSGDAGISGGSQSPLNWGPPSLLFTNGVASLSTGNFSHSRSNTNAGSLEHVRYVGRHTVTMGGGGGLTTLATTSQLDPRGTFTFSGSETGSPVADFVLGLPHASSIAYGDPDRRFHSSAYNLYVSDDFRVSPTVTVNAGLRWEFESPMTETAGRIANLQLPSDFSSASAVVGKSLLEPDWRGLQPRAALAWRPVAGSSLVIRGGYGIYRNTATYQSLIALLAQQPPLTNAVSLERSQAFPLTLADGFPAAAAGQTTFAVDPQLRVGFAQNWQVSAQRDLPYSLTVLTTFLGSKGSHLLQQFVPNSYPVGGASQCAGCPTGFVYLTSGGDSVRHAAQFQLRRRLRAGLAATVQYTVATAHDDATAFSGAAIGGASIAQNWLDLDAEYGPSSFDQRHQVTAQVQFTTGSSVAGGALVDGMRGTLIKDWTFVIQTTAGSGLPVTPLYPVTLPGTAIVGAVRARTTGEDAGAAPAGYYFNPAAFAPPASGEWGNAGRNSLRGPAQFTLNAAISRTFRWGPRLNLDWRIDGSNILNTVTFATANGFVSSPQFGLPTRANQMRRLQTSVRVRF